MTQIPPDMRENIFILSGPSGCGKNTVFTELKKADPYYPTCNNCDNARTERK